MDLGRNMSPEKRDAITAVAANRTMSLDAFLQEIRACFPELDGSLCRLLVERFRAPGAGPPQIVTKDLVERTGSLSLPNQPSTMRSSNQPTARRSGVIGELHDKEVRISRDLLSLVYGARQAILDACMDVDGAGFGTVSRDDFSRVVERCNIVLNASEQRALSEFVDIRSDGLVPYRLAMHRIGLRIGNPSELRRSDPPDDPLPAMADVSD